MTIDRKAIALAAIRHEETPVCPYTFRLEDVVAERLDVYYGGDDWRTSFRNYIVDCGIFRDGIDWDGAGRCTDEYGSVWRTDMRPAHLEVPALAKPALEGYVFPDPATLLADDWEEQASRSIQKHSDRMIVGDIGAGVFERCWMLRGFLELLTDAAAEPSFFEDLAGAITDHQLAMLDILLELPIDGVKFSDDWGDQRGVIIGPDRWRRIIKPNVARLYAKVRSAGKVVMTHCCGSVADIIADLIEIGLDVLESVQPEARGMNPYELKNEYGDRLTFWGGLGSQSVIPFGTPDELRAEIRRLAAEMTRDGGYILSPAKALLPETPTQNAVAILEEFIAAGEYNADKRIAPETR